MSNVGTTLRLFSGTFAAVFLLVFGVGTLISMVWPAALLITQDDQVEIPELPLAGPAEERPTPEPVPARELYPALSGLTQEEEGNFIRIPAIGVNVPLVMSDSMNDSDILATLAYGAALYPNGIEPGHLGNTFIAAHSTGEPWKGKYRFAFLKLNDLEPGNVIHLDYNGTRYTYEITEKEIVKPSPSLTIASDRPVPTVTLMACWPLWTTNQRILIKGELTNVTKLTPQPA